VVGEHIVLTNGFIKKTRKTPKSELELARKYKAEYERRHCHE
jgi:phage-related protein